MIRGLRARDEAAFTECVLAYQHKVFNICLRVVGDRAEAEDVAQEVFVAVFKYIDSFRGDSKFSTWLYRVAINRARNRLKYLSRRAHRDHQAIEDTAESQVTESPLSSAIPRPDGQALGNELERIVQDGLAQLGEDHRMILVLRDVENLSYKEISEIVDLNEGTVKSRLFRARVALKEYVDSRYDF
ncbi:MAG: sigma-70 family RNA polymerase sigma factor [Bradymonadaceae bacterium]|nr:sigma-70 family RNA polymerase sigma factor [Lujinxingiaceae bacterium]